jgi:phosphate uptake regulator
MPKPPERTENMGVQVTRQISDQLIVLRETTANKITAYLRKKPYEEVFDLLQDMQNDALSLTPELEKALAPPTTEREGDRLKESEQ